MVGVDPVDFRQATFRERVAVVRYALSPFLGATIVFSAVFLGLGQVSSDASTLVRVSISLLVASIILCFDFAFISHTFAVSGARQLEARKMGDGPHSKVRWVFVFRAGLSVIFASVFGLILGTILYSSDSKEVLEGWNETENSIVREHYMDEADKRVEGLQGQISGLDGDIQRLKRQHEADAATTSVTNADLVAARQQLERIETELADARNRARHHRALEAAEARGIDMEGASGRRGCYDRCLFHRQQAEAAEAEIVRLS